MAVVAKFIGDFSSFSTAVEKAEAQLIDLDKGASKAGTALNRMVEGFSGRKLVQDALVSVEAVERIGGVSKLTAGELAKVQATATAAADKLRAMGQDVPPGIQKIADSVKSSSSSLGGMSSILTSTFGQFTLANLASTAITSLVGSLQGFIATGAKLSGVEKSFEKLAGSAGTNSAAMLKSLQTATKGLVSNYDLMASSNKALLLGLPVTAESMGELAKTATTLGKAMGQDATKSLDDLITALGRSSPMILDNLGLTVKVGEANEEYAEKMNIVGRELTDAEKKMAFYEAAMRAAEKKTKELGEQTRTFGEIVQAVWVSVGNHVSTGASIINEEVGAAIENFRRNTLRYASAVSQEGFIRANQMEQLAKDQATMVKLANEHAGKIYAVPPPTAAPAIQSYSDQLKAAEASVKKLTASQTEEILAAQKLGVSTRDLAAQYKVSEVAIGMVKEQHKAVAVAVAKHVEVTSQQVQVMALIEKAHQHEAAALKFEESQWKATTKAVEKYLLALPTGKLMGETIPAINAIAGAVEGLGTRVDVAIPKIGKLFQIFGSSKDFGAQISSAILGAFQGGGNPLAAAGSLIGGKLGTSIGTSLGSFFGKTGAGLFSNALGGMFNAVLPGVGALLGPLLGKIGGAIAGLFDRNKGRDIVEEFAKGFGGFDALHKQLNVLGAEGEKLWIKLTQGVGRNNPNEARAAVEMVTKALDEHKAKQVEAGKAAEEAAAKQIEAFTAAQQKALDVVKGLDSQIKSLEDSIANEAPEEVMGIVEAQTRARIDGLKQEREAAQSALEVLTGTMTDSIHEVADAIRDLPRDIEVHIRGIWDSTGRQPDQFANGGIVGSGRVLPFASGGFVPRGTDTVPAMLTPGEVVLNAAQQKNLASSMFSGGGGNITIEAGAIVINGANDPERVAEAIMQRLRREKRLNVA